MDPLVWTKVGVVIVLAAVVLIGGALAAMEWPKR